MHCNLRSKLTPENLGGLTPSTLSVLGVLLNQPMTVPEFDDLVVGLAGKVYIKTAGENPQHVYIGPLSNVQSELMRAAAQACLTPRELQTLESLFVLRTGGQRMYH